MPENTLLLVDGTAVAYRAFYAIAELSTRAGKPTNAVFGFIKMLQQLEQLWKPTHWTVVFDGGTPEERLVKLPTYKAQREPMPEALRAQFADIERYLDLAGVQSVRMDRQEADDVIATLASSAADSGVLIATSDKDLFQLINDRVFMISPSKAGSKMGSAEVLEKTGVRPEKIVEWLALTGDTVDNIPGVPGVGPKTAAKLLAQFGSLENLWSKLDEVASQKLREALVAHRADVVRNVELVTLRRDLQVPVSTGSMGVRRIDPSRMVPFYEEMEFGSLARRLREELSDGPMLDFGV
jgi:DNA polymerase I